MRFAVCVESDVTGWSTAHAVGLPGCYATAGAPEVALEALFAAIPAYWDWLRGHGLPAPGPDDLGEVTLGVIEYVRDRPPGAGALFAYERTPPTRAAVESTLSRLQASRADLLALLDGRVDGDTTAGPAAGALMAALAASEAAYAQLFGAPPAPDGGSGRARLDEARAAVVRQVRALPEAEYDRVVLSGAEEWNVRKLLRRLIEAERTQTVRLAALLAGTAPGGDDRPDSG